MDDEYQDFLRRKAIAAAPVGFEPGPMNEAMMDFQAASTAFAIRQGRAALYLSTGLGKSICQLEWLDQCIRETNKPGLLLAPLAVAKQFEREASKFGYDAHVIRDMSTVGKHINIVNYDRLDKIDPSVFGAVSMDECFAQGTEIDTPNGRKRIENIRPGDYILNCHGIDRVSDVHRREVQYGVVVKVAGTSFLSSPNHPIFTQRGWVGAQYLRPGDYALETGAAMRLVRGDVLAEVSSAVRTEVLRDVMLSEMAHDTIGDFGEGSFIRCGSKTREEEGALVCVRSARSIGGVGEDNQSQPNIAARGSGEDICNIEGHEPRTIRAWGEWSRDDIAASVDDGCSWTRMGSGISVITGPTDARIPNLLQNRLWQSSQENSNRGGWIIPQGIEEGCGPSQGCNDPFSRVDGIEILEPRDCRLDQFRDAEGKLYFYDLGATRHPSYSVNGYLVHNSSILKSYTGRTSRALIEAFAGVPYRLCATATPAPNDHAELGSQAEFLGIMTQAEMLVRWFINDTNDTGVWRLKGHARSSFYDWMASWARMAETPADLGFDASRFVLPPLNIIRHQVQAEAKPAEGMLFDAHVSATNMHDLKRQTSRERAILALDIVLNWQPCGSQNTPLIGERNTPQTQMFESVGSSSLVPETTPRNTVALTTAPTKTNGSEPRNSGPPSISGEGKDTPPTKNTEIASRMQSNPHPDKIQQTTSQNGLKSNSASQSTTTTPCSKTKADCAEYAGGTNLTDTDISALTTATQPEQSEVFCATSAILRSDYLATIPMHLTEHRPTSKPLRLPAWVLWCDTNDEQLHLEREFGDLAISITGAMSSDRKEELHEAWLRGDRPVLITKSSIFGYGMNWQHCHNVVFVGRTFSYEMWFQAVRRCWRFGQTKPVNVHLAVAQGEDQIGRVIDRKSEDHKAMMAGMAAAQRRNAGASSKVKVQYNPIYLGRLPKWLISA